MSPNRNFRAPPEWPSLKNWLAEARSSGLRLFPSEVYQSPRVDHRILGKTISVIADPIVAKQILANDAGHFGLTNLHKRTLKPALGDGIIVAEGMKWRIQRRIGHKIASLAVPELQSQAVTERLSELINSLRNDPSFPSVSLLPHLTLAAIDVLVISMFKIAGFRVSPDVLELIKQHRSIIEDYDILDLFGLPFSVPSPKTIRAKRTLKTASALVEREIHAWRQQNSLPDDLALSVTRDLVFSLLSGFESLTLTNYWALSELADNPSLQDEIFGEVLTSNVAALDRGSKLDAVLHETMRLFPPLPMIFRQCKGGINTEVGNIAEGSIICISPWIIHRNILNWEDASSFVPERWSSDLSKNNPAYIPFGFGKRQCVGIGMTMPLLRQMISTLLRNFEFSVAGQSFPQPRSGISLRPETELSFVLSPRNAST